MPSEDQHLIQNLKEDIANLNEKFDQLLYYMINQNESKNSNNYNSNTSINRSSTLVR